MSIVLNLNFDFLFNFVFGFHFGLDFDVFSIFMCLKNSKKSEKRKGLKIC